MYYEVLNVYKESVGAVPRWYNNRVKWDKQLRHQ